MITKVEDPEELDTRFAKFSPTEEMADVSDGTAVEGADEILDLLRGIMAKRASDSSQDGKNAGTSVPVTSKEKPESAPQQPVKTSVPKQHPRAKGRAGTRSDFPSLVRAYVFDDLDDVIRSSGALGGVYSGANSLYHLTNSGKYLLVLHQSSLTPEEFNKVCNILSEYGTGENFTAAQEAYLKEHTEAVIEGKALQKLVALT